MSQKLVGVDTGAGSYAFDASAKTITFSDVTLLEVQILSVINLTNNITIYKNDNSYKGGSFLNNVLTLDFDTSSMNDNDELQIFVWLSDA